MPGPPPKRSTERRRRNKPAGGEVQTVFVTGEVIDGAPETPKGLHPIAADLFESLRRSGQAQFFEPSDWAYAQLLARETSRLCRRSFSAHGLTAVMSGWSDLLVSEGARRRARLELERRKPDPELRPVAVMDDYRDAFG